MAFGNNFSPVEQQPALADGEYKARIKNVSIGTYTNGNEYCKVELEISGQPNALPNTIILNETPQLGSYKANGMQVTEKDVNIANGIQTRFFDAFGIQRGNFVITQWKGKIGWVKCGPQKNKPEFKQLTPFVKTVKDEALSTPKTTKTATPKKTVINTIQEQLPVENIQVTDLNNFPDEVIF